MKRSLERITDHLFLIKQEGEKIGQVMDTKKTGDARYIAVSITRRIAHGKTIDQATGNLLEEEKQ